MICPDSLDHPLWKEVCADSCVLVHPEDLARYKTAEEKVSLIPLLLLEVTEAIQQRDLAFFQRDGALEDSHQFERAWKNQMKTTSLWKKRAEAAYDFWDLAKSAGGGFVCGALLTLGGILYVSASF